MILYYITFYCLMGLIVAFMPTMISNFSRKNEPVKANEYDDYVICVIFFIFWPIVSIMATVYFSFEFGSFLYKKIRKTKYEGPNTFKDKHFDQYTIEDWVDFTIDGITESSDIISTVKTKLSLGEIVYTEYRVIQKSKSEFYLKFDNEYDYSHELHYFLKIKYLSHDFKMVDRDLIQKIIVALEDRLEVPRQEFDKANYLDHYN
jgi:hypothetical protein